ncbi:MAG: hypothetical protein IJV35_11200 [Neisseriaceae bacterium]|nr:hypothetical protein [Neisseriaceae bacterium]MBQ9683818.1 hypothetical protein [Neisseriaceae bacterium]MBQ9725410.1 hypothetical protein [Neisseriaceae bacterium]MBR1818882.1 hypothetical protein [Neisseriaceae bacterium]
MGHLFNIFQGMALGGRALHRRSEYHLPINGFAQDRANLSNDLNKVVKHLNDNARVKMEGWNGH